MADKLVSVKISKAEREKWAKGPSSIATDAPLYPWGLSVTLDEDTLKKLGLKKALPEVGATLMIVAKVEVTSSSINETTDGVNRSLGLQITDLCLEDEDGDAAGALYGKEKK